MLTFLGSYCAIAALMLCTFGPSTYQTFVVPRTNKTCIRACAILGFALASALWPLVIICAVAVMLADSTEGGSP